MDLMRSFYTGANTPVAVEFVFPQELVPERHAAHDRERVTAQSTRSNGMMSVLDCFYHFAKSKASELNIDVEFMHTAKGWALGFQSDQECQRLIEALNQDWTDHALDKGIGFARTFLQIELQDGTPRPLDSKRRFLDPYATAIGCDVDTLLEHCER